ncbi:GNAT family N-acetyltransferase [Thermomonospora umbrina]|nr:GNAT family N-acetyltransferase [Thermomonospora umbrina]
MSDVVFERLNGAQTMGEFDQIQEVYVAAFPDYSLADHRMRTERQAASPGFETVTARVDGVLVGFAYGLPLSARSTWWEGLEPAAGEDFVAETGSRTFAVIDLAVLPAHRGRGLGRRLMAELLGGRSEERATLATNPNKRALQEMYERWGWRKAGRVPGGEGETQPVFDLYVIDLR